MSPSERLEDAAVEAAAVAKKAGRLRKNLQRDNFYANKLFEIRAGALSAFSEFSVQSAGDTSALAELMEKTFAADTKLEDRLAASRDLRLALRTTWKMPAPAKAAQLIASLFPPTILDKAKRGYLTSIGRQMNGCFDSQWYDACAVMMRRLVEIAIIEAFEGKGLEDRIKDGNNNYFQLTELVATTLSEPKIRLSRPAKTALPKLRDVGHQSAHGRYFHAQRDDIERVRDGCRVVVEELLHHAGLL
jgi:hypothetical protein